MADASSVIQGYIKKGYTVTGSTYEELGKAMGVDAAAFAETTNTRAEKFPPRLLLQPAGGKMAGSGAGQQKKQ